MRDCYLSGRGEHEVQRLRVQAEHLVPSANALLRRAGLAAGDRVLDLACGPRGILELLSARVGPHGRVVGVEKDPRFADLARRFAADRGLANVTVVEADARATGLPGGAFDWVHARLLLVNVAQPEQIVTEMARLARPGGVVASDEVDYGLHLIDPPLPAFDKLSAIYFEHARRQGVDLFVGRRVHRMMREAGLEVVDVSPRVERYPPGHPRRTVFADFLRNTHRELVASGLVGDLELERLRGELEAHLDAPGTLALSHLFVQTHARRPAP